LSSHTEASRFSATDIENIEKALAAIGWRMVHYPKTGEGIFRAAQDAAGASQAGVGPDALIAKCESWNRSQFTNQNFGPNFKLASVALTRGVVGAGDPD
jgi:hypothetical protein